MYVSFGGFNPNYPRESIYYPPPPFVLCICKKEVLVLGDYILDSRDKHRADFDISRLENSVFVFEFVLSSVDASPFSGTSGFYIRDRWFDI